MKLLLKTLKLLGLTFLIAVSCLAAVLLVAFVIKGELHLPERVTNVAIDIEVPEQIEEILGIEPVTVDGYSIEDYDRDTLAKMLKDTYKWNLVVKNDDITIKVDDAISDVIDRTLAQAYGDPEKKEYQIALPEETVQSIVKSVRQEIEAQIQAMNKDEELLTFDEGKDEFIIGTQVIAPEVDYEAVEYTLSSDLTETKFDDVVDIPYLKEADTHGAEIELIGEYITNTTNQANRNANIELACQTINGTILEPGEEFFYNKALGPRTPAKGYKEAGVYLNGEHATGYGGGICQLSSTLYNAVFAANLEVTQRTGHTFEPSYVKPGLDATVSYSQPEFAFKNSTDYPVGLYCHYEDRVVTVRVYGVRTLEEGVTRYMRSARTGSVAQPETIYQDNPALAWGQEVVTRNGYAGSAWATYEVLEKDGEVISDTYIYTTKYKGEAAIVQRNFLFYQ